MGPMSPTILDMAQVFGLRPSGRVIDVTQDWIPSSTTGAQVLPPTSFLLAITQLLSKVMGPPLKDSSLLSRRTSGQALLKPTKIKSICTFFFTGLTSTSSPTNPRGYGEIGMIEAWRCIILTSAAGS
ncbi:hypothetical protein ACFX2J_037595 [Malus domestica]